MSQRKILLKDLRVIDLRAELEKRNLDKSGVRGVLVQRLSKHLVEEGLDPETCKFDLPGANTKSSPQKKAKSPEPAVEPDNEAEMEAEGADDLAMEDVIVLDDTAVEKEAGGEPASEAERAGLKRETETDSEAPQPKKPCLEEEQDHKNENEADDSINLSLGEDELLNEENDSTSKAKMDEATEAVGANEAAIEEAGATSDHPSGDQEAPASDNAVGTSAEQDGADKEKDDKTKEGDSKPEGKEGARNLWVSGLSTDTRARDLKQMFSNYGKVIGAKIVTNAKTPGTRCYGYVTMSTAEGADNCVKYLHRTELHGRIICVEKAKSESDSASAARSEQQANQNKHEKDDKKQVKTEKAEGDTKKDGDAKSPRSVSKTRDKPQRSDKDRVARTTNSRERRRSPKDVLSFNKIWNQRSATRTTEASRAARDAERRRRAAEEAMRERERRQRQESDRLAKEREAIRAERAKLERERHRLEREQLEMERAELKREQQRLEMERRAALRRPVSPIDRHKRTDPPPPPRFVAPALAPVVSRYDRDRERERERERERGDKRDAHRDYGTHVAQNTQIPGAGIKPATAPAISRYDRDRGDKRDTHRDYGTYVAPVKYPINGSANDDGRQPLLPGTRPKETGGSRPYEPRQYLRPSPTSEPRSWTAPTTTRYSDNVAPKALPSADPRYPANYQSRYQPAAPTVYQPPATQYGDRYTRDNREYRKY